MKILRKSCLFLLFVCSVGQVFAVDQEALYREVYEELRGPLDKMANIVGELKANDDIKTLKKKYKDLEDYVFGMDLMLPYRDFLYVCIGKFLEEAIYMRIHGNKDVAKNKKLFRGVSNSLDDLNMETFRNNTKVYIIVKKGLKEKEVSGGTIERLGFGMTGLMTRIFNKISLIIADLHRATPEGIFETKK